MKTPMADEFTKIAQATGLTFVVKLGAPLTEEQRSHISGKNFAVSAGKSNTGHKAYPIEDKKHARIALGLSKMHGDAADIAEVKKDVAAKYPDLAHKAASAGLGSIAVAIHKFANASCKKEKDGNMGGMGPASGAPPGMMGGPAPGQTMKATMQAGM